MVTIVSIRTNNATGCPHVFDFFKVGSGCDGCAEAVGRRCGCKLYIPEFNISFFANQNGWARQKRPHARSIGHSHAAEQGFTGHNPCSHRVQTPSAPCGNRLRSRCGRPPQGVPTGVFDRPKRAETRNPLSISGLRQRSIFRVFRIETGFGDFCAILARRFVKLIHRTEQGNQQRNGKFPAL